MPLYKKKPIVVEAIKWNGDNIAEIIKLATNLIIIYDNRLIIKTLEGNMEASVGDYIIKGVNGEIYPCKPDIFEKTYDKVEE